MGRKFRLKIGLVLISAFVASFAFAAGDPVASVKALREKLMSKGEPKAEGSYKLGSYELPVLKFGSLAINTNENAIVDGIKDKLGGVCTIFVTSVDGQDYVRASTNVLDKDGKRCMGTPLKRDGPVFPVIRSGKSYTGEADICGTMYNTYYEPIKIGEKVAGIYLCGFKKE